MSNSTNSAPSPAPNSALNKRIAEATARHDIFKDPALNQTLTEDPVFKFLAVWWKQLLIVAAAVAAALFAKDKFAETSAARIAEASEAFNRVTMRYEELQNTNKELATKRAEKPSDATAQEKQKKELEDLEKRRTELRTQLGEALMNVGDAPEPYRNFLPLYQGLVAALDQKDAEAIQALGEETIAPDNGRALLTQSDKLVSELKALAAARLQLDDEKQLSAGRAKLKELALKASFVNTSAALTLVRISTSAEEKKEADDVVKQVENMHPEQAELLQKYIANAQ